MDRVLKIKVLLLIVYALFAIVFFYDEHFVKNSSFIANPHHYNNFSFMFAVFSLGIIFSALVYNLAFYLYIRNRQYLYYALAQFSVLLSLLALEGLQIYPFTKMYNFQSFYLLDVSQTFMLIFSLLFIKEFFQTSKISLLNHIISIVIYLALFDLLLSLFLGYTFLTKFIPTVIWIWFILSEVFRQIKERGVPFYFVMIGWHSVIVLLLLELSYVIDPHKIDFPFLHMAFAFESMLLSFALSYKFKLIDEQQKIQQTLLLQQSRLASMGEMVSIIAHQWRQPLNFLSYSLMYIKQSCNKDEEIIQTIKEASEQLQYMSKTIENFRNFYNPSKKKEYFSIEESCQNILKIVNPTLKPLAIKIELEVKENFTFFANSNEFEQVLLNIINNAKETSIERKIKDAKISICIEKSKVSISDNAGGIALEDKKKIFEPYFTTKDKSDGIGLYIAKTIIEQEMGAKLNVESDEVGSLFILEF
jgi:signal transduction histidine kinase